MEALLETFRRVARRIQPALAEASLEAHAGCWLDSAVLKLQKPGWTETKPAAAPTAVGIFFSVWIEQKAVAKNQVFYNVHALRLRDLAGYALESRKFAAAFRARFARHHRDWPNVSVDHGPRTPMQGWIALDPPRLEDDVAQLALRFIPLAGMIDALLAERKA